MDYFNHTAFQQGVNTGPIIFMHWVWDGEKGPIHYVSPNVECIFGYTAEEFITGNITLMGILKKDYDNILFDNFLYHIEKENNFWEESYQIYAKSKEVKHIHSYTYVQKQEEFSNVYVYLIDETDLVNKIQEKDFITSRYEIAIESAGEGVWDWNITTNEIYFSDNLKKMLGYSSDEMENRFSEWEKLVHSEDYPIVMSTLRKSIEGPFSSYESKYRMLHKDGSYRWILSRGKKITSNTSPVIRMIGTHVDITEQKQTEELLITRNIELEDLLKQIKELSITDPLTSLYNRRKILEDLSDVQKVVREQGKHFAFSVIDIDYFKRVNDQFGHSIGDEVLVFFANFIKNSVRKQDIVGRWGGEEFVVIFPDTSIDEAYSIMRRLQTEFLEKTIVVTENIIRLTFSAGISGSSKDATIDEIISEADNALYVAKEAGRNLVIKYEKGS